MRLNNIDQENKRLLDVINPSTTYLTIDFWDTSEVDRNRKFNFVVDYDYIEKIKGNNFYIRNILDSDTTDTSVENTY